MYPGTKYRRLGIGRATARLFAKEGCRRIAVADLHKSRVTQLKKEIEQTQPDAHIEALEVG